MHRRDSGCDQLPLTSRKWEAALLHCVMTRGVDGCLVRCRVSAEEEMLAAQCTVNPASEALKENLEFV